MLLKKRMKNFGTATDGKCKMTIFRHTNGKLYTLELIKRRMYTEAPQLVATPYRHNEHLKHPVMKYFTAIAEC
jgi:hypothetical protein